MSAALLIVLATVATFPTITAGTSALPELLRVDWQRLPDIPAQGPEHQGFQDSDGGWINKDVVVTAFGYSAGGTPGFLNSGFAINVTAMSVYDKNQIQAKTGCSYEFPGNKCPREEPAVLCKTDIDCRLPACGPGGCTCHGVVVTCKKGICASNATLCSNSSPVPPAPGSPWQSLPAAPVNGRQEVGATVTDDGALVYVGGFSYTSPFSYSDVLRLARNPSGEWSWESLPSLPYPVSSMGVAAIGSVVYVLGGADYDGTKFTVFNDRKGTNPGLGKHLLMLNLTDLDSGWKQGPDMVCRTSKDMCTHTTKFHLTNIGQVIPRNFLNAHIRAPAITLHIARQSSLVSLSHSGWPSTLRHWRGNYQRIRRRQLEIRSRA